jgi:3-phosphoshikimate 1-carboxyvinyltransferase
VQVPGDKSVSHRALIFNALAEEQATIRRLSAGADVSSTQACLRALGVEITGGKVAGVGLRGLRQAAAPLDCGNSGTTMRLLAGVLAAQPFPSTLTGDASLAARPMERVAEPLRLMGGRAQTAPLVVGGGGPLRAIDWASPIASAQVKSAVLLAGLYALGTTRVTEPSPSRDHTERMLRAMGAPLKYSGCVASLVGPVERLRPLSLDVPGDLSAAAFWLVAAGLSRKGSVRLPGVGTNPSRTAMLDLLDRIGLRVRRRNLRQEAGEPSADLEVNTAGELRSLQVGAPEAAALIDELPVLAVAAALLPGTSRITGAAELRVKESDRIAAMASGLRRLGATVDELPDGWEIEGGATLFGARVESRGDHRVAMALAVAGLLASGETEIEDAECVAVSYPDFWDHLESLCST